LDGPYMLLIGRNLLNFLKFQLLKVIFFIRL